MNQQGCVVKMVQFTNLKDMKLNECFINKRYNKLEKILFSKNIHKKSF